MKKILESNLFILVLFVILFCYLFSFISNDVVLSDKVYQKYLDDKYETKYDEYKDLNVDLSEFEEELKQFEETAEDSSYDLETLYIDSLFVLIPLFIVVISFSGTFLILILFHKKLHVIKFIDLLKVAFIGFTVFYVKEIISAVYFLVFNSTYEMQDIKNFESYFKISTLFSKENTPNWLWQIVSETGFIYLLFPLIAALLISILYSNFKKVTLIGYAYLSYAIIFILYNTVFWYLFDLI
jgi:hypothetical protein